jgi:demethylmacrocin O-methyltransferase
MKSLDEIAIEHQTDRATVFTRTWGKPHGYAPHYDKVFGPFRHDPVKLLEIGSASGEGVRMWLDYFCNGRVFGVDNVKDTCDWNMPGKKGRFTFVYGDQGHDVFWKCFLADYGKEWDFVIDDGSHVNSDIITSFNELWPHVKPGGFYAIEDLACAYGGAMFVKSGFPTHISFLKDKLEQIQNGVGIDSMYMSRELAILRKATG